MRLLQCLNPVSGYRIKGVNPSTGRKFGLVSVEKARRLPPSSLEEVAFRCGKCLPCLKYRGSIWMARCIAESRMHDDNAFITLTVDDASLDEVFPFGGSLDHLPFQLFMKRLRKNTGVSGLKYMMCGEYGEFSLRPHYHAIIFGLPGYVYKSTRCMRPDGLGSFKIRSDNPVFQNCWPYGNVYCGSVTPGSIAYVSGYTMKQLVLGRNHDWYLSRGLSPEYVKASRRPGLGFSYFQKYGILEEHQDGTIECGVPCEGNRLFPGRYFLDWLRLTASDEYDKLLNSYGRTNQSEGTADEFYQDLVEFHRRVDFVGHTVQRDKRL